MPNAAAIAALRVVEAGLHAMTAATMRRAAARADLVRALARTSNAPPLRRHRMSALMSGCASWSGKTCATARVGARQSHIEAESEPRPSAGMDIRLVTGVRGAGRMSALRPLEGAV